MPKLGIPWEEKGTPRAFHPAGSYFGTPIYTSLGHYILQVYLHMHTQILYKEQKRESE